jgi:hypothetical protein
LAVAFPTYRSWRCAPAEFAEAHWARNIESDESRWCDIGERLGRRAVSHLASVRGPLIHLPPQPHQRHANRLIRMGLLLPYAAAHS